LSVTTKWMTVTCRTSLACGMYTYIHMCRANDLDSSVSTSVSVDGFGETSLLLIDVVNGASLIRRVWIWWWYHDDYLACWWTKETMKRCDSWETRNSLIELSWAIIMWILMWFENFYVRELLWFQRFISYLLYLFIVLCSFISLCCKYCYYLLKNFNKNIYKNLT